MRRAIVSGLVSLVLVALAPQATAQVPPESGTGVDRNGIMSRRAPRVRTYTIPQGGYSYWGYYSSGPGFSYYPGGYYYNDFCPYCGSPWCYGNCWYRGPVYLPPIAGDASALYGNRAAQRFLGVGGGNQQPAGGGNAGALGGQGPLLPEAQQQAAPRVSNPTARAQAWKFVEYGDRQFQKGNYRQAFDRYEKAGRQAADVADIHFRKAFALTGQGKYVEATEAIKRGLQLKPSWPQSGFVLEELYPTAEAKREVFRQLTLHVNDHPRDAEALYMLAVLQHFDGQEAAAEVKFRSVIDLLGQAEHAEAFLPPDPAPAPDAANGGAANPPPPAQPAGGAVNRPGEGFGNLPPVNPQP